MDSSVMNSTKSVKVQNGNVMVNNGHRTAEQRENDALFEMMGITSEWEIENIKDVAMNRFNVKKVNANILRRF